MPTDAGEKANFFDNFRYLIYGAIIFFVVIENNIFFQLDCRNPTFIDFTQIQSCGTGANEGVIFDGAAVVEFDVGFTPGAALFYFPELSCDAAGTFIESPFNLNDQCDNALPQFTFEEIYCQLSGDAGEFLNIVISIFFLILSFQTCLAYANSYGRPRYWKLALTSVMSLLVIGSIVSILAGFIVWSDEAGPRDLICRDVEFLSVFFIFVSCLALILEIVSCSILLRNGYKTIQETSEDDSEVELDEK